MKKHISIILILALVISVFSGIGNTTLAVGAVEVKITPGTVEMTEVGAATLSVSVTNNTDADIPAGCVLKQGGTTCATFEQIPIGGTSAAQSFSFNVTEFGSKLFQLYNGDTPVDGASATVTFTQKVLSVGISASFSVDPSGLAGTGDIVTLKFTVQNTGEAKLTDIFVKVPGVNGGKALNTTGFSVEPGKSKDFTYPYTVTAAATLTPVIEYKVNGAGNTLKYDAITPISITLENRKVELTVEASDRSPNSGDTVTFTVTITNNGNVSYTNMKVYIDGEQVEFKSTKLAQGATYTQSYDRSYTASKDVRVLVTLVDHKQEEVKVEKTVSIEVPIDESDIASNLTLDMEVDRPTLTSAGTVTFKGYILNSTDYELKNLVVMEPTLNIQAYNSALLPSNQSASFEYETNVTETTTFNFQLTVLDSSGVTHTVTAEPVSVTIMSAGTPSASGEASASPSSVMIDGNQGKGLGAVIIIAIVLVVLIIGVGVALLVLWRMQKTGRGGGGSKTAGRTAAGKPAAVKKRPALMPKRKGSPYKGYRDRNNF